MKCLVVGIICFAIGYLDPIVIWRKMNEYGEKTFFPKMMVWRNSWRDKIPPDGSPINSDIIDSEK